jgi:hypothetical protein
VRLLYVGFFILKKIKILVFGGISKFLVSGQILTKFGNLG